jgi:superfamily I DNA and RNA helicase
MAHLIPETLHSLHNVTPGEASVFRLLQQKLDDQTYVWFNIPIRRRHADFVILNPQFGLLILEVKDWQLSQMKAVNPTQLILETGQGEKKVEHPLRQARDYALHIADILNADQLLVRKNGTHQGRLSFPFGYGVVWTKIREEDFKRELFELYDPAQMLFRESLHQSITTEQLIDNLQRLFPQQFKFNLTPVQIDRIRYHIFPEVRLPRKQFVKIPQEATASQLQLPGTELSSETVLTVMDLEQERLAKSFGEGHRLLRGVAGSGKTWTLVCRARILAELNPKWKILVLCYNVSLASLLKQMITSIELPKRSNNIKVQNFHLFLSELAHSANLEKSSSTGWAEDISRILIKLASASKWKLPIYDAILIDEAHDFHTEWLRLTVQCLNPQTNSLFIVHDSAQNIYRKGFSFKKVGVQIKGRTKVLRTNYRNTREIAELASCFLSHGVKFTDELIRDDEGQLLEIIRPQTTLRTGPRPLMIANQSYREECAETAARVKLWMERNEYPPQEILILYVKRGSTATDDRYIKALLTALDEAGVAYDWITRDQKSKRQFLLTSPRVKVSTIHSAKGLDFAAVAMVGISMLPSAPDNTDMERKLIYVGLTRARHTLLITHCKDSQFILELKECLKRIS